MPSQVEGFYIIGSYSLSSGTFTPFCRFCYISNIKKLILLLLIVPLFSFGQKYYVSAEGGLNVRILPELNTTKVGSLMYK